MTKLLYSTLAILFIAIIVLFSTTISAIETPTQPINDVQTQGLFVQFMKSYKKAYAIDDLFKRFNIFRNNVEWMINFNNDRSNTHQVGINFFTDLAENEWSQYKGLVIPDSWKEPDFAAMDTIQDTDDKLLQSIRNKRGNDANGKLRDIPDAFDWEKEGALEPIRNQGSCGSCYSQAAMATVEALHHINFPDEKSELGHLSTQQGVDCTGSRYGCNGCSGGWMTSVYRYLIDAGNACSDESYPYVGRQQRCQFSSCEKVFAIHDYTDVSGAKESTLLEHLTVNPQAIAVTSNTREFMYYKSGIITRCGTSSSQIDHAVTTVGYDKSAETPFVRIRNSWGPSWGEDGYVRVAVGANVCKWRSNVSYPALHSPTH